jgi:hypothetical protein
MVLPAVIIPGASDKGPCTVESTTTKSIDSHVMHPNKASKTARCSSVAVSFCRVAEHVAFSETYALSNGVRRWKNRNSNPLWRNSTHIGRSWARTTRIKSRFIALDHVTVGCNNQPWWPTRSRLRWHRKVNVVHNSPFNSLHVHLSRLSPWLLFATTLLLLYFVPRLVFLACYRSFILYYCMFCKTMLLLTHLGQLRSYTSTFEWNRV